MLSSIARADNRTGRLRSTGTTEMTGKDSIPRELIEIRNRIDEIDQNIIELLHERFKVTHEVGLLKAEREMSSQDAQREEQKLEALGALSESHKLEPTLVRELFRRIMEEVVRNHERIKMES